MSEIDSVDYSIHRPSSLDPADCDHEPLHRPGCIQPHGVLLVLEPGLIIQQVSDNIEDLLGLTPDAALGRHLTCLMSARQTSAIAQWLTQEPLELVNPFLVVVRTAPKGQRRFQGTLHRVGDRIILELEPQQTSIHRSSIEFYQQFKQAIASVRYAHTLDQLAQGIAQEVHRLSGFARVMVYRFEMDQSGVVIAEARRPDLETYLGLHYPASDIPSQARRFYYDHWLRLIPDATYQPARLIPECHPHTQEPLDLSRATLRSVSSGHLQYLKNMGVAASFSISLINEQRLWGLIVCHHDAPKWVNYETRRACELLGQFLSVEFVRQQERDFVAHQAKIQEIQRQLQLHLSPNPVAIAAMFQHYQTDILRLVQAQGAALWLNQRLHQVGETPDKPDTLALLAWIRQQEDDIFCSDRLVQLYPEAIRFKDIAAGILSISIVLKHTAYHLIWFRQEQVQTVHWAGNPHEHPTHLDDQQVLRLSPRGSFERWKEVVRDRSLPWQPLDLEAARQLRNTLMLAALEFSHSAMQKLTEQAEQANRAKSQFLAKMSHELRTPLNAILGFTQLMSGDRSLSLEHQEHLGIIGRSGEHLLALINDVLEMSKIEAGQVELHDVSFDLHRTLRSTEEMFALKTKRQGLALSVQWEPDVPQLVYGDQGKLRQILINLLGNAVKFTERGRVSLHVSHVLTAPSLGTMIGHVWLQFCVTDTGPGIHPQDLQSIFDAFQQTERTRQFTEGSGLGLSISRQFARMMGGELSVQSQIGQGSTFTCVVPLGLAHDVDEQLEPLAQSVIALKPHHQPVRILVAEDVAESRLLLVKLLESVGFQVWEAVNGEAAIALWVQCQPDLVLMDLQMPGMDGLEATRAIRQAEGTERRSVILVLSASAFHNDRKASFEAGCDDFLSKPFQSDVLLQRIGKHLNLEYIYADAIDSLNVGTIRPLNSEDLRCMPRDWQVKLREAAIIIDEAKLYDLVAEIPSQSSDLAVSLTYLIDNFQLEAIVNLTGFLEG